MSVARPALATGSSPPLRKADPVRVLIVDDSAVARAVIARMIDDQGGFEIAACVESAAAALGYLARETVDIILLDIMMPERTGLCALPDLIAQGGGAPVLIVSATAEEGAAETVRALALGAADTLAKPGRGSFGGQFAKVLGDKMLRLVRDRVEPAKIAENPADKRQPSGIALRALGQECPGVIAVGASTGGLHALSAVLRALPAIPAMPILVTQHLPPVFMPYFARQLTEIAHCPAKVAADGDRLTPGAILVAPGEAHLRIERVGGSVRVRLDDTPAISRCLPSVDPMFDSVAEVYGRHGLGVVLSGMGRDGEHGARTLVAAGGQIIVQDHASSVVWGMPGTVAQAGLASAMQPPDGIAAILWRLAGDGT